MSAKQRRKIFGVRRQTRRPRDWARWYREGVLDEDPNCGVRVSTAIWSRPRS